ncbi:50S ribosomal protein L7ae [Candidatus Woesearchaeota archaeon]|nr:50S ribosomal protein L7ae [Candidatus Woesearchaeota archaeon]
MADKELADKALEAIEIAKTTGKIKKGANEATKALERGNAKLVAIAKDVSPPEITMHIPIIAKEKSVPCIEIETKEELGVAAGIKVGTSAIAIVAEGTAKKVLAEINKKIGGEKEEKAEEKEEKKEEKEEEKPKKEKKAEEKKKEKGE